MAFKAQLYTVYIIYMIKIWGALSAKGMGQAVKLLNGKTRTAGPPRRKRTGLAIIPRPVRLRRGEPFAVSSVYRLA